MALYFVEGTISIRIDVEIEADSLEDAEQKVFDNFKVDQFHLEIEDRDLHAGQYEGETYTD